VREKANSRAKAKVVTLDPYLNLRTPEQRVYHMKQPKALLYPLSLPPGAYIVLATDSRRPQTTLQRLQPALTFRHGG
jgi:hypothetical protein